MAARRVGVWLIGAWGGVATTVVVGLQALKRGLHGTTGLVTALPQFEKLGLVGWDELVVGGHEIRETNFTAEAHVLYQQSRVFSYELLKQIEGDLAACDVNVKPGTLINSGARIATFAGPKVQAFNGETATAALARLAGDMKEFQQRNKLDTVVVVNVASTEPSVDPAIRELTWPQLKQKLDTDATCPVPASTLYAIAAFECGFAHVNFTPSVGTDLPAMDELARAKKVCHAGRDGKTGETLMKAVLAPMFAARNLHVMSWVGHNIFGNLDGKVLDDPVNKANKVRSKDHLLTEILGYKPQTLVSIEYIESLGDWKTAWDHIHFEGFLGTKMALQFTWQGCDSLLAAPLVIDLVRLTDFAGQRNETGLLTPLAPFFKSPMGCEEPTFALQHEGLLNWMHSS